MKNNYKVFSTTTSVSLFAIFYSVILCLSFKYYNFNFLHDFINRLGLNQNQLLITSTVFSLSIQLFLFALSENLANTLKGWQTILGLSPFFLGGVTSIITLNLTSKSPVIVVTFSIPETMIISLLISLTVFQIASLFFQNAKLTIWEFLSNTNRDSIEFIVINNLKEFILPIIAVIISIFDLLIR